MGCQVIFTHFCILTNLCSWPTRVSIVSLMYNSKFLTYLAQGIDCSIGWHILLRVIYSFHHIALLLGEILILSGELFRPHSKKWKDQERIISMALLKHRLCVSLLYHNLVSYLGVVCFYPNRNSRYWRQPKMCLPIVLLSV